MSLDQLIDLSLLRIDGAALEPEPEPEPGPQSLEELSSTEPAARMGVVLARMAWQTYAGEVAEIQRRIASLVWPEKPANSMALIAALDHMRLVLDCTSRSQLTDAECELERLAEEAEIPLAAFPAKNIDKLRSFLTRCSREVRELDLRPNTAECQHVQELFRKMQADTVARLDSHLNAGSSKLGMQNEYGLAASRRFENSVDVSPVDKARLLHVDLLFRCVNFSASESTMSSFGVKMLNSGMMKGYRLMQQARVFVVNTQWLAGFGATQNLDSYLASKNAVRVANPVYLRAFPGCALAWVLPTESATSFIENIGVDYWTLDLGQ